MRSIVYVVDDLKSAVLEISRARDASESSRQEVTAALTQEMEVTSMLRAENALLQSQHQEALDRVNTKVNSLTRFVIHWKVAFLSPL